MAPAMESITYFLEEEYYGNSLEQYLIALAIFAGLLLGLIVFEKVIQSRFKKFAEGSDHQWDDYVYHVLAATRFWFFFIVALYGGSRYIQLTDKADKLLTSFSITVVLIQVAIWGNALITRYIKRYRKFRLEDNAAMVTTMAVLGFTARLVLYSVVLLLILENVGIDVTALVAGLGVTGVAVALAAQNVLGDLFASLAIAFDKPFVIGDFIITGDILGNVERIGMKTTRIRSLGGEEIVLPNSDLMSSRIRNYKRMQERRIVFSIGVIYQTPSHKLERVPAMIKEIIDTHEKARFDRAHFKSFGNFSLDFEIVYYVLSADYNEYMDIQQALNLALFKKFEQEGIDFAYPTQTLFMESVENQVNDLVRKQG